MLTGAFAPARGVQPEQRIVFAIAAGPFAAFDVGQFDIARDDPGTLDDIIGSPAGSLSRVVAPTADGIICGILGVWQQNVAAGQRGRILLIGETKANIVKASGNVSRMERLCATTSKHLSPDHQAGDRVIAVAREPLTAPTTATPGLVLFHGINGLAQFVS